MAPVADDTGTRTKRYGQGGTALSMQADQWMAPRTVQGCYTRDQGDPERERPTLEGQANSFLPPSFPNPATLAGGTCSTDGPNSNQHSAKRKLNPIFVEALMRWPTGLSGFERQETAWTLWWRRMPSFVSALASQKPAQQAELF